LKAKPYEALQVQGYSGSRGPVYTFAQRWWQERGNAVRGAGFVPLSFELGAAFQFDWSCEHLFIGGLRRRLEVAHTKLAASRAFCLVAYYSQAHEMLFDAHARAFALFGGVPRRGIYNMKTAVDKVGQGKQRSINARFEAMTRQYKPPSDRRHGCVRDTRGCAYPAIHSADSSCAYGSTTVVPAACKALQGRIVYLQRPHAYSDWLLARASASPIDSRLRSHFRPSAPALTNMAKRTIPTRMGSARTWCTTSGMPTL